MTGKTKAPKPMSLTTFLRRLKALDVKWRVQRNGLIRCERGDCPITAVARAITKKGYSPCQWAAAAQALGLNWDGDWDGDDIVAAADGSNTDLRPRLLRTLGLKEKPDAQPAK